MQLKVRLEQDIKTAMLAGDKVLVSTLRGVKSTILYAEVAANKREEGLSETELTDLLRKELKKRLESAELFERGGNQEKAAQERSEATVIENYLPAQMPEEAVTSIIDEVIAQTGVSGMQSMGQVIGAVKTKTAGQADGALIARLVKERLE